MQTTQYLTHEELKFLDALRNGERTSVKAGLFAVPLFIAVAALLFNRWLKTPDNIFIILTVFLSFLALAATYGTVKVILKLYRYSRQPAHGNIKFEISDQLLNAELIKKKFIRYTLSGQTLDLYIPTPYHHRYLASGYKGPITKFQSLTNVPVKLSYVTLDPGVNILLGIHYDHLSTTETIVPLDKSDKYGIINNSGIGMGAVMMLGTLAAITIYAGSRFSVNTLLTVLVFPMSPIALISVIYFIRKRRPKPPGPVNKIIITSTVTEMLTIEVKSQDNTSYHTYFRLGDGSLEYVYNGDKINVGDNAQLKFVQLTNGKRGDVFSVRKV